MRRGLSYLLMTGLGGILFSASPTLGFVRSYTEKGCHPVFWAQSCIYITPDSAGLPEMPLADVERVTQEAIQSWQMRTGAASFLQLKYLPASAPREVNARDGLQVLKFHADSWCRTETDPDAEPTCFDPGAIAVTTVTYVDKPADPTQDGRILDADIELNAVYYYFFDEGTSSNPPQDGRYATDLWNTLTHELGHLQGLEHTCRKGAFDSMVSCTRDSSGQPVISCATVDLGHTSDPSLQAIYDTSMYPNADPREIKKRIPKADDLAAVINTYPISNDPRICKLPEAAKAPGGCNATGSEFSAGMGLVFWGVVGLCGAWWWRRRQQARVRRTKGAHEDLQDRL